MTGNKKPNPLLSRAEYDEVMRWRAALLVEADEMPDFFTVAEAVAEAREAYRKKLREVRGKKRRKPKLQSETV